MTHAVMPDAQAHVRRCADSTSNSMTMAIRASQPMAVWLNQASKLVTKNKNS